MPISVDTVYQKVLALANKEQRGYITPQEFNLFANQAQMEIFEQYFYDLNQFARVPGNEYVYSDIDDMLEEKLQIFDNTDGESVVDAYVGAGLGGVNKRLPDYIYRVHRVEFNNISCEILKTKDFNACRYGGPLVAPSNRRPVVNIRKNIMRCVGDDNSFITPTGVFYFKAPQVVSWGYIVVTDKALYDETTSTDFELHLSEESELIYRILALAGISIEKPNLTQMAAGLEQTKVQQEKQ